MTVTARPRIHLDDMSALLGIRAFEEMLLDLFGRGELGGTTHTCLGQEHVPVALMPLLGDADIVSNHRGHGHYLARYDDPAGLLAEVLGRVGGLCAGRGGSQHLYRAGFMTTGVQGSGVPIAAGRALDHRLRGAGGLAVAFMGDGTWGEGVVYETLNLASRWRLPLVLVTEHNGIAQTTPTSLTTAGTIEGRCAAFDVAHVRVEGTDIESVRSRVGPLIQAARRGAPLVIEYVVERLGPHSKGDDTRESAWLERAHANDWYTIHGVADDPELIELEARQRERMRAVCADVMSRPLVTRGAGLQDEVPVW